jgi:26S proteasome non-ATPase regulatory subunit 10
MNVDTSDVPESFGDDGVSADFWFPVVIEYLDLIEYDDDAWVSPKNPETRQGKLGLIHEMMEYHVPSLSDINWLIAIEKDEVVVKKLKHMRAMLPAIHKRFRKQKKEREQNMIAIDKNLTEKIHNAAKYGHVELCQQMINLLPRLYRDDDGRTPMHTAALYGHLDVCRVLAEKAPDAVATADDLMSTPLQVAAAYGNLDVCLFLLEKAPEAASVRTTGLVVGLTALHGAAAHSDRDGFPELCRLLVQAAPETAACIEETGGTTPLHRAARCGNIETCRLLIQSAPETVSVVDNDGQTPLRLAAAAGHAGVVEECLAVLLPALTKRMIALLAQAFTKSPPPAPASPEKKTFVQA